MNQQQKVTEVDCRSVVEISRRLHQPERFLPSTVRNIVEQLVALRFLFGIDSLAERLDGFCDFVADGYGLRLRLPAFIYFFGYGHRVVKRLALHLLPFKHFEKCRFTLYAVRHHAHKEAVPQRFQTFIFCRQLVGRGNQHFHRYM